MMNRILATFLGILAYWSIFPVPVQAGRYVLNQSFETVESYFGPHLVESSRQQWDETWTTRTYANVGVRQSLPNLPANAQFKTIFVNGKAQWIVLAPGSGDSIPVEDAEWQIFQYDQETAFNFFNYIFGYRPASYTPVPGYYGGGHEGFYDERICLGDGIQTTYTEYGFGIGEILLSYTVECEAF